MNGIPSGLRRVLAVVLVCLAGACHATHHSERRADVCVYGATSAGVIAAIAAAREG